MEKNFIGLKIQLYPTEEQKIELNKYFGIARFMYNYGIDEVEREYKETGKFIGKYDLNNRLTEMKNQNENSWMLQYDSTTMKIVLFDVHTAYRRFLKKLSRRPRRKCKKAIYQQFPIRPERMSISADHIKIPGFDTDIKCGHIPNDYCIGKGYQPKLHPDYRGYHEARIIFDGLNYYLSVKMIVDENINIASYEKYHDDLRQQSYSDIIGIDFGFSKTNWIVDSNGNRLSLPDDSKEKKKIKHFQRKLNRQIRASRTKKRSKNRLKTISTINKYYKRITHRKEAILHDYISHKIVQRKPLAVVIEDITVNDFLENNTEVPEYLRKKYNGNIYDHMLYRFQELLGYKCLANDTIVIRADKQFPSTKRCSSCGHIQEIGRNKIYRCPVCGMVMNRDDNAAKNLSLYPTLKYLEMNGLA